MLPTGNYLWLKLAPFLVTLSLVGCELGCTQRTEDPLTELGREGMGIVKEVASASKESLQAVGSTTQAGIHGINPGYRFRGMGGIFNGFIWDSYLGFDGVAGQLQTYGQYGPNQKATSQPTAE